MVDWAARFPLPGGETARPPPIATTIAALIRPSATTEASTDEQPDTKDALAKAPTSEILCRSTPDRYVRPAQLPLPVRPALAGSNHQGRRRQ